MDKVTKKKTNSEETKKPELTKADAAKAVFRLEPVLDDEGKQKFNRNEEAIMKKVFIKENEVLSFADYGDRIAVVTTSGEKLVAEK